MNSTHNLDELPWDILRMEREIDPGNKDQLMMDLHTAIKENHFHAFYALAIKYMEIMKWDSNKVEIIRSTNKLLMEPPRPSHDIPTEDFEALNAKILSSIQGYPWSKYGLLERFLASDPLLFRALSTRSCPLETQFYLCMFTRQTDDLLDEMSKNITIEFGPDDGRDQSDEYPIHNAITWGTIHILKLILIYDSGSSSACLLKDWFGVTPLHLAVQKGLVSEINILLSTCWECAGMVSDNRHETALHCALSYEMGYKAFKTLLQWYIIKEEFLNNSAQDWECGDTALDLMVDGYVKTVKELLFQSGSNVCFQRDSWATKEYFVVIKCKDKKSKYEDCVREVTSKTTKRTILSLSVDSRSVITLKVLIRSGMVKGILSVKDYDGYTVFDRLDKIKKRRRAQLMEFVPHEEVECAMGTLLPKWCNEISNAYGSSSTNVSNDAKEELGEGTESCHEGVVAYGNEEQLSVAANEPYENVLENVRADDHRNGNAEDDNQEMPTDINISDKPEGSSKRKQVRISLRTGQEFATLEECRNAIKDAAILVKTGVTFTKSTRKRVVAECSNEACKWKIRAQAKSSSKDYVVNEIAKEHTCPPLNGTTNMLATPIWVSSHIIDRVRQEPNISTQQIKDIMKQSKYKINITRKTAERAKKRALVTIQLQQVSKKQRQNTIAAASSSNAHQSLSNVRFLEQIPEPMHKYIHGTEDVEKDGHCGYRVIAMQSSGYEAMDAWKQVRTDLLTEVVRNDELYVKLMDIGTVAKMRKAFAYSEDDDATDPKFWLSLHEAGYVIANACKAVVVSLSLNSGNLTFLPLLKPPPEGRPHCIICFGFVNGNHFISLNLKPDAPIPRVDRRWDTTVSKAAQVWKTPYLDRFDEFEEIMGINLGNSTTGSGSLPIIVEP